MLFPLRDSKSLQRLPLAPGQALSQRRGHFDSYSSPVFAAALGEIKPASSSCFVRNHGIRYLPAERCEWRMKLGVGGQAGRRTGGAAAARGGGGGGGGEAEGDAGEAAGRAAAGDGGAHFVARGDAAGDGARRHLVGDAVRRASAGDAERVEVGGQATVAAFNAVTTPLSN